MSIIAIRGLKSEDDAIVYKYKKLTKAEYDKLDVPVEQTSEAVFAFAKGHLAEGSLNTAKYALGSTFDATLVGAHARALTNNQVAAMSQDLDTLMLTNPAQLGTHAILDQVLVNKKIPFLTLINLLDANRGNFLIGRAETGARVFSIDHGVAFSSADSDRGDVWRDMRVKRLPADTVARLRTITLPMLEQRLSVLAQWKLEGDRYVPTAIGANQASSRGVRRWDKGLQVGLTAKEISSVHWLLGRLLKRIDAGEFTLVPAAK